MCGIIGVMVNDLSDGMPLFLKRAAKELFLLAESRGKEAAGVAVLSGETIHVYKEPVSASAMMASRRYKRLIQDAIDENQNACGSGNGNSPFALVGHSRLVTNGLQTVNENNQPIITSGMVGVHNGIIVNDDALWGRFPNMERRYQVDTEVVLSLIAKFHRETGSLVEAVRQMFSHIEGSASIAVLSESSNDMVLATNTGSLYLATIADGSACFFASERHILQELGKKSFFRERLGEPNISQVKPGSGYVVNLEDLHLQDFLFDEQPAPPCPPHFRPHHSIVDISAHDEVARQSLRRCKRCILPETMPFIKFDEDGICNYCHNYRKMEVKGHDALDKELARYRSNNGAPDCIVAFSGGRDSSYGLHYLKNVLGMHPITFTYDWGMITDLGRRNQARVTGQMGVEQILISADIKRKRKNIRQNIRAWLKRPNLGMIPIFMAGDKQFFYYANLLRKQLGIDLVIFCVNPLEKTSFKTGFCGVNESSGGWYYNTSVMNKLKLTAYYARNYALNPRYLNASVLDTLSAYFCSFMIGHDYLFFNDYIRWNEKEINSTLIGTYNWETATDTDTTWRIGDGTAAFYNYIYYTMAGFTENDTLRSNQVREGTLTREEALRIARKDNQPRYESLQWYAREIGFDCDEVLSIINSAPKLYKT